jgi:hypothetical protein
MGGGCSILNLARKQTSKYDKDNTVSHEFKKIFFILNEQIYLDEPVSDEADLLFI